jgi:hypothetical protein
MRPRSWLGLALIACAGQAIAGEGEDKALATELFRQGRALMAEKRYPEACRKLEESHRLVPAPGTLLNLGLCHEAEGKLATAWGELVEARTLARRDKQKDRERIADEKLRALEPRLPRLTIVVPAESDLPGLQLTRDGTEVGRAAWGSAVPVDPGERVIEASAEGREPRRVVVAIAEAESQSITIEPLVEKAALPEPAALPPPVAPPAPPRPAPAPAPPRTEQDPSSEDSGSAQRTAAYVSGGLGLVFIGVGSYFGIRAMNAWSDSNDGCPRDDACTPDGAKAARDAGTFADIATVAFGLGAVGLVAGGWLYLTADPDAGRASLSVAGRF